MIIIKNHNLGICLHIYASDQNGPHSLVNKELCGRLVPDDYYHQTFQVKKVFGMNTSMYGYNAHADKPRKSSRKYSECGKSGHTKSSCPKKKKSKAKKKTN